MVRLIEGARPEFSMAPEGFHERAGADSFWGVPLEYFEVRRGRVYMDARLASLIDWNIDAEQGGHVNLNAPAQKVYIDGRELSIPAGFFCSYVDADEIREF